MIAKEQVNSEVKALTFDAAPCLHSTIDDLDIPLFQTGFLYKIFKNRILEQEKRPIKQQLASLNLYSIVYDCPTVAGILLVGKDPVRIFHGAYIQYVKFEGQNRASKILDERQFSGNFITMLRELDGFVKNDTIRELIVNNIMHRDYQTNAPSKFYEYADRIEIDNPGNLYGKVNVDNLFNETDYRNPIIAQAVKELGYANRIGCGLNRLEEKENSQIAFDLKDITTFKVIVTKPNSGLQQDVFTKEIIGIVKKDGTELSAKEKLVLDCVIKNSAITQREMSFATGLSLSKVGFITSKLKKDGILERLGSKINGYWKVKGHEIKTDITANDKTKTDNPNLKRVLDHIIKNPTITYKELTSTTGFKSHQVANIMSELVSKEMIERVDGSKKGYWRYKGDDEEMMQEYNKNVQGYLENSSDCCDAVLECMKKNPRISAKKIAVLSGYSKSVIANTIAKLKTKGIIERVDGSDGNYWKVQGHDAEAALEQYKEEQKLLESQTDAVEHIKKNPYITNSELATLLKIPMGKAGYYFTRLKTKGIIERIKDSNGDYWKVGGDDIDVALKRHKKEPRLSDKQKKAIEHIRKNPYLTSAELSSLMGVTRDRAGDYFTQLKKKGIIKRIKSKNGKYWRIGKDEKKQESSTKEQENSKEMPNHCENILAYLEENTHTTAKKVAESLGISKGLVHIYIRKLKKKGILERVGNNTTGYWIVKEYDAKIVQGCNDGRQEHFDRASERCKNVLRHIKEDPYATAEKIAALLGISEKLVYVYTQRLRAEGILERVGKGRTGYWKVEGQEPKTESKFGAEHALVLENIIKNPSVTNRGLSDITGLSRRKIHFIISKFKAKGVLGRVGNNVRGYWAVMGNDAEKQDASMKIVQKNDAKNVPFSENQKKLLEYVKKDPHTTLKKLSKLMGVSESTISICTRRLKKRGILEHVGNSFNGYWKITENNENNKKNAEKNVITSVEENAKKNKEKDDVGGISLSENQRKLLNCVKEDPYVTLRKLSKLMNVSETTVSNSTKRLKELGILERVGDKLSGYWKVEGQDAEKMAAESERRIAEKRDAQEREKRDREKREREEREKKKEKREERVARDATNSNPVDPQLILEYIEKDPSISYNVLAAAMGTTQKQIQDAFVKLKADGLVERVDGWRRGYWKINTKNAPEKQIHTENSKIKGFFKRITSK